MTTIVRRLALAASLLLAVPVGAARAETIRVGHFPNITHIQALVAQHLSRENKGWFEQRLGPDVKIDWYVYNAGPSAMEAVFADAIDLTYVGPSPALNAYARSKGEEVRIVAGAATGGAALVVQADSTLATAADFRGKKIATPQLGNTQDVSARAWLTRGGLHITLTGGDAQVIPTENPDQLAMFKRRDLDAVWTVEPWVTRLEQLAGGKVLVEEKTGITTVLVSSAKYLAGHADMVRRFVAAHRELTTWIAEHPAEAQAMVREEMAAETHGQIAADAVARAWARITLSADVSRDSLEQFVANAKDAGFLRNAPDLGRLIVTP